MIRRQPGRSISPADGLGVHVIPTIRTRRGFDDATANAALQKHAEQKKWNWSFHMHILPWKNHGWRFS
jgi:hypothetical protein